MLMPGAEGLALALALALVFAVPEKKSLDCTRKTSQVDRASTPGVWAYGHTPGVAS